MYACICVLGVGKCVYLIFAPSNGEPGPTQFANVIDDTFRLGKFVDIHNFICFENVSTAQVATSFGRERVLKCMNECITLITQFDKCAIYLAQ